MHAELHRDELVRQKLESLGLSLSHFGRLCAAGELAAGISHELQQPLTAINIYADTCLRLLASTNRNDVEIAQALHDVQAQVTRAATIIKRLRRFVRRQPPSVEKVRLRDAVDNVLVLLEIEAHAIGAIIEVKLDASLPFVLGDPIQIEQVVLNLMRNGIEAVADLPGTQKITMSASVVDGNTIVFEVCNFGPPIPESVRRNLFQPFFTTKKEGLGMGLYIARMIVEAHRGTIECTSDQTRTCFVVQLPTSLADTTA